MRLKILLFAFLLWGSAVRAQDYIYNDTINYLVITEYRGDNTNRSYLELTNMGDQPVQLNQFEIGHWGGGALLDYTTGKTNRQGVRIPTDKILQPGESYVFAAIKEFGPRKYKEGFMEKFPEKQVQDNMWEAADFYVHLSEEFGDSTDIVTPELSLPFNEQWGGNGFFIEQHFANGDSMVVDQVGATFTGENGANPDRTNPLSIFSVAGAENAIRTQYLIRRNSVKKGTLDFNNARGVGLDDSEWIPIPIYGGEWRLAPWTVGNQGDYKLDANTLESDIVEINFQSKTLTVPWGITRGDEIMSYFKQKPGIGWEYVMGSNADSLTHVIQTGDTLRLYVCGDKLDFAAFNIIVKEPAADANRVVQISNEDPDGGWRNNINSGYTNWPRITQKTTGIDSIWGAQGGIPYATRVDSLLERLEKPSNAAWEIVYASGVAKPDLFNGDKLKVIARNGSVKEYFISVLPYRANSDAYLTAIQWPDIPEFYKGIYGWIGDTIPGFGSQVYNYNVQVPLMAEGIPALVATKSDVNATIEVNRAKSLSGSEQDRTITFTVTAEDDSTINNYLVVLNKELNPENLQPNFADPIISEVSHNLYWNGNDFLEICNPGNQPLDLSNYMIAMGGTNPATLIAETRQTNWLMRYEKYIPGYKWANEADWMVNTPYITQSDISVNSIIQPGFVFVLGAAGNENGDMCNAVWDNPLQTQLDIQFMNKVTPCHTYVNQWGENVAGDGTPFGKWHTNVIYLFKILNDSIKQGLKPATDPNDFELIDVVGKEDGSLWKLGTVGINNPFSLRRKPEITKGNPVNGVALGTSPDDAEYSAFHTNYYAALGQGWPWRMLNIVSDIGKHYFIASTDYMSTVASVVYKVSEGYSLKEQIRGITTGTKVADFLANLIKKNENQSLKVTSVANGAVLAMDALLSLNDTLTVLSADSTNTTKYVLEVLAEGLSSNAVLTSTRYKITVDVQPKSASDGQTAGSGTVSGFDYGTALRTVINNITVPAGANMSIISADGSYVPVKQLNFDSTYVFVTVNSEIYLDVLAENGLTNIKYRLTPQSSTSAAFVLSNKYAVSQKDLLIDFVPGGINVSTFLSYLVASDGASMKLVDKMGFERLDGTVADDDKLVVTSADKTVTAVYHIGRLATQYVSGSTYLAYILSKEYAIDQVVYKVAGVSGAETVSSFLTKVTPAAGASVAVIDKNEDVKINGDINGDDMVKVTSADGKIVVTYTFGPLTATSWMQANQIELYPNPSNGRLNVTGVQKGQRIQIYNSVGSSIIDIQVLNNHEIININEQPAGLYMIVVSDKNGLLGKYKAIKY
jgi:hypothetical protein